MLWMDFEDLEENEESIEIISEKKIELNEVAIEPPKQSSNSSEFLDKFSSVEELESLGLEQLKLELQKLGLLCGGTLKERAQRLFSIKGKDLSTVNPKLFAKKGKSN